MLPKLTRSITLLALIVLLLSVSTQTEKAQEGGNIYDAMSAIDPELSGLVERYVDGENLILGIVDSQVITVDSIKSELGSGLDAAVNTQLEERRSRLPGYPDPPRDQMELAVIYYRARTKAIEMILTREADALGIEVPDAQVDGIVFQRKVEQNIDPKDLQGWARFTLQNFNKTPLELREEIRSSLSRQRVLAFMAGEFGPIPGIPLPVFFPLDVTPREMLERYEETKEQWKQLVAIRYSRLAITFTSAVTVDDRRKLFSIAEEASRRVRAGETFEGIKNDLQRVIDQDAPQSAAKITIEVDVEKASDADVAPTLATKIRSMKIDDVSDAEATTEQSDDVNVASKQIYYVVKLHDKREDISRSFDDPVVQRELYNAIRAEKRSRNYGRVEEALVDTAVILPKSLRAR